jgi:NitT/TauT family transport system permease protein
MKRGVLAMVGLGAVLAIWEGVPRLGLVSPLVLPPPSCLPLAWWRAFGDGWPDAVLISLGQYLTGLAAGAVLGIALGFAAGLASWLEALLSGGIRVLRPVPGLAWLPLAIVWFGFAPPAAVFVVAIGVFWLGFQAALVAVRAVDRDLIEMAAAYGQGGRWPTLIKIILPGATAGILTGIRAGLGQGWLAVIGAGLVGIPGLGQRMQQAATTDHAADIVLVYIVTIAVLVGVTDALFVCLRDRLLSWQR